MRDKGSPDVRARQTRRDVLYYQLESLIHRLEGRYQYLTIRSICTGEICPVLSKD
ncbi:hypothetical protein J6590_018752 [Homalodisca vitripennis]|nr:hypothetical protein J6590_018752 [Homalodisca vitripennis]